MVKELIHTKTNRGIKTLKVHHIKNRSMLLHGTVPTGHPYQEGGAHLGIMPQERLRQYTGDYFSFLSGMIKTINMPKEIIRCIVIII